MTRFCGCIGPRPYEDTISSLNEALRRAIRPPRAHKPKPDKLQEIQNCTTGSAHGQVRTGKYRSFMRRRCWEAQLRRVALDAKNAIAASGRCSRAAHFDRLVLGWGYASKGHFHRRPHQKPCPRLIICSSGFWRYNAAACSGLTYSAPCAGVRQWRWDEARCEFNAHLEQALPRAADERTSASEVK